VLTNDSKTEKRLAPSYAKLPRNIIVGTIFHVESVSEGKILSGHALTAEEFRKAATDFSKPNQPSEDLLIMSNVRQELMTIFHAKDAVFYRFDVQESSGKQRRLTAYVMAIESKKGTWFAGPGITGEFYSYEQQ